MLTLSRVVFIYPSLFFPSISRAKITNSTDTMNVMAPARNAIENEVTDGKDSEIGPFAVGNVIDT